MAAMVQNLKSLYTKRDNQIPIFREVAKSKKLEVREYISMIDLQDKNTCPTIEEIGEYVRNSVFTLFCS